MATKKVKPKPNAVDPPQPGDFASNKQASEQHASADASFPAADRRTRGQIAAGKPLTPNQSVTVNGEPYEVIGPARGREWVTLGWRETDPESGSRRAYGTFHQDQITT